MTRIGKTKFFFWTGLTGMTSLLILMFLWSMIPFGGDTLPHVLEQFWGIQFLSSAILLSLFWGLLGVGTMLLLTLRRVAVPEDEAEQSMQRSLK